MPKPSTRVPGMMVPESPADAAQMLRAQQAKNAARYQQAMERRDANLARSRERARQSHAQIVARKAEVLSARQQQRAAAQTRAQARVSARAQRRPST